MKRNMKVLVFAPVLTALVSVVLFAQEVPPQIKALAEGKLKAYGTSVEIVKAVKEQNAKNIPVEKLKELDKKWLETTGVDDFMTYQMTNMCAQFLRSIKGEFAYMDEMFVMDNKGANVGITSKTTNYWRGDKDKFTKSYKNGAGAIYYGKPQFDASTKETLIQISIPVMDSGKAIGVIVFGISVEKFKE